MPQQRRPWLILKSKNQSTGFTSTGNKFYQTSRWRKDRAAHLQANPLCVECQKKGIAKASKVSDHIIPINEGGEPWDWNNRQALCFHHHSVKSAKESHR